MLTRPSYVAPLSYEVQSTAVSVYMYVCLHVCALACRNKDQMSLTKPRDALHHGERAANKQGGCSL